MTPLSIIVPTLNEAAAVGAMLATLQPLRAAGYELIVVDGGSVDGTQQQVAAHVDLVLQAPRGRARQMNAGARAAQGAVLWFLHADTLPPPQAGKLILEGLARSGRDWGRFDVRLSGAHTLLRVVERLMNLRSRITGIATGDQGMFVRREVFERLGGFPDIELMEDVALSRALNRLGPPLCLDTPLQSSSRRWERRGIARTILLMWSLRLAYALGVSPARLMRWYR
jgi:rSAM/selenodomain-associated transferase 2